MRILSWLICQSYDDKGNAIIYEYAEEDEENVDQTQVNERYRVRTANCYLKRIKSGNRKANRDEDRKATDPVQLPNETWMFEVDFDYDEGHYENIELDPTKPDDEQHRFVDAFALAKQAWSVRQDQFSSYRASFEVRIYRSCRRVLIFQVGRFCGTGIHQ